MRAFLAALSVLSVLPLGRFCPTEAELRRCVNWFPAAGLLFGALFFGIGWCLARWCAPLPAALLLAVLPEALTKGFHLDGLADTADGFLSGRPRERKLEIMRDSHIGTMGVAAIVALLGMKFALYASLPGEWLGIAAGGAALCGRCGVVFYIAMSRYARPSGLGALWFGSKPVAGLVMALAFSFAAGIPAGIAAPVLPALLVPAAFLWSRITHAVIGGATGDTIGCFEELCELLVPAVFLIVL